jgi:hypothetical protein
MKYLTALLLISTPAWADRPDWTFQTNRQVLGGDIIQWGTGSAKSPEVALFKARQMAIKTLIEECGGIANKDIIPRKQYVEDETAYATVSLSFDSCEQAKRGDKRLENPKIVEEQKLYDRLLGMNEPSEAESQILKYVQSQNQDLRDDITRLNHRIDDRAQFVVLPVKLPATNSMKAMCLAQARNLRVNLQTKAIRYNGNAAAPELASDYQAYQQQADMCEGMN